MDHDETVQHIMSTLMSKTEEEQAEILKDVIHLLQLNTYFENWS